MTKQQFQHWLIVVVVVLIIAGIIVWMRASYHQMQVECELMGGRFYSISFTQNICVNGDVVRQL